MDDMELPPPSAELALIRELIDWYLSELPRRDRDAAVRSLNTRMAGLDIEERFVVLRPARQRGAVIMSRRLAANWWRAAFGERVV